MKINALTNKLTKERLQDKPICHTVPNPRHDIKKAADQAAKY